MTTALVGAIALATLAGFLGYVKGIMDARCHSCEYDKQYKRLEDAEEVIAEASCEHSRAKLSNDRRRYYCAECGIALTREYAESIYADCVLTCEYCTVVFPHGRSDASALFDFCSKNCEEKWIQAKPSYCSEGRHADCKYWLIVGCDCPCHSADRKEKAL